jgi:hypothetical protein
MVPLEMHGMIRYCQPPEPLVGLYRQSCCPFKTKDSYDKARAERDIACFPSMLHQMVSRFKAFRALRRICIQAIHRILSKGAFCNYLTHYTMKFLTPEKPCYFPYLIYSPHHIRYELLTIRQRFIQFSGKLVSLGYSKLTLPEIDDYEYEVILSLCHVRIHSDISALYHQLKMKKVKNRWRIILSYVRRYKSLYPFDNFELPLCITEDGWENHCNKKKVDIYLDKCFKMNGLSAAEIVLIYDWISYMKYPLH